MHARLACRQVFGCGNRALEVDNRQSSFSFLFSSFFSVVRNGFFGTMKRIYKEREGKKERYYKGNKEESEEHQLRVIRKRNQIFGGSVNISPYSTLKINYAIINMHKFLPFLCFFFLLSSIYFNGTKEF